MNCENCSTNIIIIYGSGRFCSQKCARGFSTKKNRKEINEKVSYSLKGRSIHNTNNWNDQTLIKIRKTYKEKRDNIPFELASSEIKKERIFLEQNERCNCCGITDWNGKPLSFELEHKDGNNLNNDRQNLEVLCPNCHSQTTTWRGRNKSIRKVSDLDLIEALRSTKNIRQALILVGLTPKGGNYLRAKKLLEANN